MMHLVGTVAVAGLVGLTASAAAAAPGEPGATGMAKVLITFKAQPEAAHEQIVRDLGGTVKYTYRLIPTIAASVPATALDALRAHESVAYVEPDGEIFALDDELDSAWGVQRIGAGYVHADGNTGQAVKVAVIDTGIDYTHPELAPLYGGGWDFHNGDPDPMDDHGHGTHVAGTIGAIRNGVGVVGVAPDVELYAFKVLNARGSGNLSNLIAAVEAAVDAGCVITNQSLGSILNPGQAIEAAYDAAWEAGVLHVAASGNYGGLFGVLFPARYDSVVAVGATDRNNQKAGFSSTGPQLELAAPGVEIRSTYPGGQYADADGTSMASPHVAGAAALVFASGIADANMDGRLNDDVRQRLVETAIDLGAAGRDSRFGYGLVNASLAVREPMTLSVGDLTRGQAAEFQVAGASADAVVYIAYSRTGTGPTHVPSAGLVLSLDRPALAATTRADGDGRATLNVTVPPSVIPGDVWIQAAEIGNASNVVATAVQ